MAYEWMSTLWNMIEWNRSNVSIRLAWSDRGNRQRTGGIKKKRDGRKALDEKYSGPPATFMASN